MTDYDALLRPLTIKGMTVRNRVISSSHGPGYVVDGKPTERLIRYHAEKAKGGIGLTQVGASAVSLDSPTGDYGIIRLIDDSIVDHLRSLVDAVHAHGAAITIQLIHMGRRMRWDGEHWVSLIAPTVSRERVLRGFPKEMEDFDYRRVIDDFAQAARRCKAAGFDGVEVHGAGLHLIDQHWSPLVNKRGDEYGGGFENRMRFGVEVFEAIRQQVGDDYVVGTRISGDEMIEGGSTPEECLDIARYYTERGLVDFLSVLGGSSTTHRYYAAFIPNMSLPPAPFLYLASAMRQEVDVPIFHAQRIMDLPTAARAVAEGHVDLACMTRAHIADPHMVRKLTEGREEDIRPCVGASYCVNRVGMGQDALCMYNVATSREKHIPHEHARAPARRKIVVVGAGPGGLEAARIAGERGHDVVLFEAAGETGGQLALAARVPWREALAGATRWQEAQARKHGVDIQLGTEATAEAVLTADPDVVILATGGRPSKGDIAGDELAVTTWDVLAGTVAPGENVLVYDDSGRYPAVSAVEVLAGRGAKVELVSPDRLVAEEVGIKERPSFIRHLHEHDVVTTPDYRLLRIERQGNQLVAVLASEYTDAVQERLVDQVVAEHATLPRLDLYHALRPHATNLGETDLRALSRFEPQNLVTNPDGRFQLFRIGDALSARNVHAAVYDGLRIAKDL
jgi:2,4-dienoyl-CoA reductase-like NADH-dependent reductase (Old Yellow Enzyme family)/thioredoxin reductase